MKKILFGLALLAISTGAFAANVPARQDKKTCTEQTCKEKKECKKEAKACKDAKACNKDAKKCSKDAKQCAKEAKQCRKGEKACNRPNPFEGLNLTDDQKKKIEALKSQNCNKGDKKACLESLKNILTPEQYNQFLENGFCKKGHKKGHKTSDKKAKK